MYFQFMYRLLNQINTQSSVKSDQLPTLRNEIKISKTILQTLFSISTMGKMLSFV